MVSSSFGGNSGYSNSSPSSGNCDSPENPYLQHNFYNFTPNTVAPLTQPVDDMRLKSAMENTRLPANGMFASLNGQKPGLTFGPSSSWSPDANLPPYLLGVNGWPSSPQVSCPVLELVGRKQNQS